MERTVSINNFIGVYDNYITDFECKRAISLFEQQTKFNRTINRQTSEKASVLDKVDQQYFCSIETIDVWHTELKSLIANFDQAYRHYDKMTGVIKSFGQDEFFYTSLKIQKTLPGEGYHIWHLEHSAGFQNEPRALVFSIYLNDVEEGGETEFLHFSKRVKPKAGRIVIWPSSFPYVHRGNPPLSGEKYILTSWLNLR